MRSGSATKPGRPPCVGRNCESTEPKWGKSSGEGPKFSAESRCTRPVSIACAPVEWLLSLCVTERTIASLRPCRAIRGKCSLIWMPGAVVSIGWNSPRTAEGPSGLRSHVS